MAADAWPGDIPIIVDGVQKWMTGLTRRTTCDDVIYALLYSRGQLETDSTANYAVFERWRAVERPLPGRTKIVKVWTAWGAQQPDVQLMVRRLDDYFLPPGPDARARRKHRRSSRHCLRHPQSCRCTGRRSCTHCEKLRALEQLAQQVVRQEQYLQEMQQRVSDTERKIVQHESRLHLQRVQRDGRDYVQETYLQHDSSGGGSSSKGAGVPSENSLDALLLALDEDCLDEYLDLCERLHDVMERLTHLRQLSQSLVNEIQAAARSTSGQRSTDRDDDSDVEALRVQILRAVATNVLQQQQEVEVTRELTVLDTLLASKGRQLQLLTEQLREVDGKLPLPCPALAAVDQSCLSSARHAQGRFPASVGYSKPSSEFLVVDETPGFPGARQTHEQFLEDATDNTQCMERPTMTSSSQFLDKTIRCENKPQLPNIQTHGVCMQNTRPLDNVPVATGDPRVVNPLKMDDCIPVSPSYEIPSVTATSSEKNTRTTGMENRHMTYRTDIILGYKIEEDMLVLASRDDSGLWTGDSSADSCLTGLESRLQQPVNHVSKETSQRQALCDLVLDATSRFTKTKAVACAAAWESPCQHPLPQRSAPLDRNVSGFRPANSTPHGHVTFAVDPGVTPSADGAELQGRDSDSVKAFASDSKFPPFTSPAGESHFFQASRAISGARPPTYGGHAVTDGAEEQCSRVKTVRFADLPKEDCSSNDTGMCSMLSEENVLETLV